MAVDILAFNKWSTEGITVDDPGLKEYITLEPRIAPKTGARYAGNSFHKSRIFIVERLINKVMVPGEKGSKHWRSSGHMTGMAAQAHEIVKSALEIVEEKTGNNPIAVLVKGIEKAAPREEIVTVEYGGARYPKPVEVAPQRRIDIVLRQLTQGAYAQSFRSKTPIEQALATQIIAAYNGDQKCQAIKKKLELERQADSSR